MILIVIVLFYGQLYGFRWFSARKVALAKV